MWLIPFIYTVFYLSLVSLLGRKQHPSLAYGFFVNRYTQSSCIIYTACASHKFPAWLPHLPKMNEQIDNISIPENLEGHLLLFLQKFLENPGIVAKVRKDRFTARSEATPNVWHGPKHCKQNIVPLGFFWNCYWSQISVTLVMST